MSIASEISRLQQAKEDLATAIGNKGVTVSVSATLDDFADYVDDIVTGITPTGTKSITTNGTHDVTNYASASVAVPASAVDSGTKSITTNGTHDVVGYASASVNVPSSSPTLISKSITANGTYNASADSADGYSSVTVNVPSGIGEVTFSGSLSITNNTNIWQYLGIDSVYGEDSFCIIALQNLYVRNKAMAYTSEYCVFFNENCFDQPSQSPVADANEDYKYYLSLWVSPANSTAYIRTVKNDSLSATITKIIKVQRA